MQGFIHKISGKVSGLHEAAYLLAFFTFISQLLGLFRDRLLSGTFGAGETLDIYYAAFKIPDLIFVTVASLVSISILVPFFTRTESVETKRLINGVFTFFILLVISISLVAFIIAPFVIPYVFPGIALARMDELVMLSRIMLLSPVLLGVSNFLGSIAQVEGRFLLYSLSPVLYNLGIITGIIFFYPMMGMYGLALGVVLGAFLHGLIYVPFLSHGRRMPRLSISHLKESKKEILDVARLSLPRAFALSASSIAILVLLSLASLVASGSISAFSLSFNLYTIPLSIIGISYASAAFPLLSRLVREGNKDVFRSEVGAITRQIIFLTLPAAALFIVLGDKIVRVVLATGAFGAGDVALVGALLKAFAIAIVPQCLIALFVRVFYAEGRTARPFFLNLASAIVICVFGFSGMYLFTHNASFASFIESSFGVVGVAGSATIVLVFSYVLGSILNVILHGVFIGREFPRFFQSLAPTLVRGIAASIFLIIIARVTMYVYENAFVVTTTFGTFAEGFVAGILGVVGSVALLYFMKSGELRDSIFAVRRKLFKSEEPLSEELPM